MRTYPSTLIFSVATLVASGLSPAADKTNTLVGTNAGKALTKGKSNTAAGFQALFKDKTGSFNIAIGDGALYANVAGNNNVAIGVDAGAKLKKGNDNVYIDHPGAATESKTIRIGTPGTHTRTYLAGKVHGDGSGLSGVVAASGAARLLQGNIPHGTYSGDGFSSSAAVVSGQFYSYTVTFKKSFTTVPAVFLQTVSNESDPGHPMLKSVTKSSCTFHAWGGSANSFSFLAIGK